MSDSDVAQLYRLIRDLTEKVSDLTVAVARVEERMKHQRECPNPGLCTQLEPRLVKLELERAKLQGIGMAGKAIWAIIGAGGISAASWIIHLMEKSQ